MEKCKTFFSIIIILIFLPILLTCFFQGSDVFFKQEGQETIKLRDQLVGITAKQIAVDMQPETVRAQTILARTALCKAQENKTEEPEGYTMEELQSLWGEEQYETYIEIYRSAAEATSGMVVTYEDTLIDATFHAVSAGKTRMASEVYENEDTPYLTSVDSSMDIPAEQYLAIVWFESEEFEKILQQYTENYTTEEFFGQETIVTKDSAGYAIEVHIGEEIITGEMFRDAFSLNSASFELAMVDGRVRITTKGLGHGFGMSQYGANVLAEEGYSAEEILEYYFTDVNILNGYCPY